MMRADQLDPGRAMLLAIDMQEKLLPLIRDRHRISACATQAIAGAKIFGLPVLATEQNPRGIGRTVGSIREALALCDARTIEKSAFSAWAEPAVRDAMLGIDRSQVILLGIEAHVCIQQTALDLSSREYDVFVCADAIGSRSPIDYQCSLDRMRQGGVRVTTVESVLFELCGRCDAAKFKDLLAVIKSGAASEQ